MNGKLKIRKTAPVAGALAARPAGKTAYGDSFAALDRVFSEFFADTPALPEANISQPSFRETDRELEVSLNLPGADKDGIMLELNRGSLGVTCERSLNRRRTERDGSCSSEQYYGSVYRLFPLPAEVKAAGARKDYRNGVLKVTLKKLHEAKARRHGSN